MVEQLAVTDGRRTFVVVRERVAGQPSCEPGVRPTAADEYDAMRGLARQWPADYALLETIPDEPVQVSVGACRTTPLYLAHDETTLHGSWDMADLRPYARSINVREAARLLLYRPRYSRHTLFTGIHRLTERSTAHYGGHLYLRHPAPALHSGPRQLAPDADVQKAFVQCLDDALDLRPLDPERTHFHLTGGFDSGTIATRAAERFPGQLNTSALLSEAPAANNRFGAAPRCAPPSASARWTCLSTPWSVYLSALTACASKARRSVRTRTHCTTRLYT